jgi:predicted DNA-binding transcriptional regulator AlpA
MPDAPAVRLAPEPDPAPPAATEELAGIKALMPRNLPPLLVDINGLAELLARSVASLHRDDAAGRIPRGLKLGASKRWNFSEIVAWVEAGCPSRQEWEARRTAQRNGRPR